MKKLLLIVFSVILSLNIFSQESIDNPLCENNQGGLTVDKVVLTDSATNITMSFKSRPKNWYTVESGEFIKVDDNPQKLMITSANGLEYSKKYWQDKTGKATFTCSFPPIPKETKVIHLGENTNKTWYIENIYIKPGLFLKYLPDQFAGNWETSDTKHQWTISFAKKMIIYKGESYKIEKGKYKVKKKGKGYTLTIRNKTLYINMKGNQLYVGESKKSMIPCVKINFSALFKGIVSYPIPEMKINQDTAYYRGYLLNYSPKKGKTGLAHVQNAFTGEQEQYLIKIDPSGWFKVNLPICYPQNVLFRMPNSNYSVFLVPGDSLTQLIRNRRVISYGKYGFFNDEYQYITLLARGYNYTEISKEIGRMSIADYMIYCDKVYENNLSSWSKFCNEFGYNKEISNIGKKEFKIRHALNSLDYSMRKNSYAYKLKKKGKTYDYVRMDSSVYCNILKDLPIDEESFLSYGNFSSFINRLEYADCFRKNRFRWDIGFNNLLKKGLKVSYEDSIVIEKFKTLTHSEILKQFSENTDSLSKAFWPLMNSYDKEWSKKYYFDKRKSKDIGFYYGLKTYLLEQKDKPFSKDGFKLLDEIITYETPEYVEITNNLNSTSRDFNKIMAKYKIELDEEFKIEGIEYKRNKFMNCVGERGQLLSDVMISRTICPKVENPKPLSPSVLKYVDENVKTKFIKEYIHASNKKIIKHIAEGKNKEGYEKHEVLKTEGEKVFSEIIKPYKGKVIYVDFWATWCGPCRSAIKRVAPIKEELLKRGDIVFLYITNVTSPEKLYNNMIPDIKGEHYRVSQDQWNVLAKQFNVSGIPHFMIVDKKGEVVNNDMDIDPHSGNLKRSLLKYAKEK